MTGTGFHITHDLNLAAALATCGVTVGPLAIMDEPTGRKRTSFSLGGSGHLPEPELPAEDPDHIRANHNLHQGPSCAWNISSGAIRRAVEEKSLEGADPSHPVLDVLSVLHARECLRTFMERGTRYRIQLVPGAPRAKLVEGSEPLTHRLGQPGFDTWSTIDLALAACMSRIGCPVLEITDHGRRRFILPRVGHTLPGRKTPEDAVALAQLLESGELRKYCPEHPLVWGMAGCAHRLAILKTIDPKGPNSQVLLRHSKSLAWQRHSRSALVTESAPDAALLDAVKHIRR